MRFDSQRTVLWFLENRALVLGEPCSGSLVHCMFVYGKSKTVFFPSDTLIDGISKKFNIRTCEHKILGQLRMGARQKKNALLFASWVKSSHQTQIQIQIHILVSWGVTHVPASCAASRPQFPPCNHPCCTVLQIFVCINIIIIIIVVLIFTITTIIMYYY